MLHTLCIHPTEALNNSCPGQLHFYTSNCPSALQPWCSVHRGWKARSDLSFHWFPFPAFLCWNHQSRAIGFILSLSMAVLIAQNQKKATLLHLCCTLQLSSRPKGFLCIVIVFGWLVPYLWLSLLVPGDWWVKSQLSSTFYQCNCKHVRRQAKSPGVHEWNLRAVLTLDFHVMK